MAYCYECGSEVATDDVFCPNCGITLQALSAAENEPENFASNENASEIAPQTADNSKSKTDEFSLSDTEESWNTKTESVDFQLEDAEIKRLLDSGSLPKNDTDVSKSADEFSPTIPYISPMSESQEASAAKMAEENKNSESADSIQEHTQEHIQKEEGANVNIPPTEIGIAKPAEELETPELPHNSVFDSVRIMERTPPKEKSVNNEIKYAPVEVAPAPAAEKETPSRKSSDDIRSQTTPNIGGGSNTDGKKQAKLRQLDEGTILNGRYEIIRKIGGGGMGAVYLASDNNLGGVLRAVKEMVQSYIEDEQQEKAVSDFKRESLLLTSLDHQSIPTIFDYFFDDKEARFYLVMKYISGGDLAGRLRSAPESRIDEMSVTQWAIQIADVLDYLHNRQPPIVYRDLK
ncbi:MAG: protein kinase, partial [Pyrinomonadaceae bacterium]|nr:protein kinase [Pyrinomonadaceae bacterium]